MGMREQAQIDELRADVADLRARLGQIPVRYAAAGLLRGQASNEATIGTAAEGVEAAATDTWDALAQVAGEHGLDLTVLTRLVYNNAGDEILYGYARTLTFDHLGMLREVSAETRYTIETPDSC